MSAREDVTGSRVKLQCPQHNLTQRQVGREIRLGGSFKPKNFAASCVTANRCPDPTESLDLKATP